MATTDVGAVWGASRSRFGLWGLVAVVMTAGGALFRHSMTDVRPERVLALIAITGLVSVMIPTALQAATNGSAVMTVVLSVAFPFGFGLPVSPGDAWFEPFTWIAIGVTAGLLFGSVGHAVGAEIARHVGRAPTPTIRSQFGPAAVVLAVVFLQALLQALRSVLPL